MSETLICINKLQSLSGVDQKFLQIAIITHYTINVWENRKDNEELTI